MYFQKSGEGKQIILAFHGFGQSHTVFNRVLSGLEKDFTIYKFDLYYHGKSMRPDTFLTAQEWAKDLRTFLDQERIDRFSIIAFSLGGRFALATAMQFAGSVQKLVLIAPDGIYKNLWFLFSTSKAGNPVFRYMMHHPEKFYRLLYFFEKWQLIAPSMIRFARKELSRPANCRRVYRCWTYFRRLQLKPSHIVRELNRQRIEVHMIFGEKDTIIPSKKILPKINRIKNLKSRILPSKHHELLDESKPLIEAIFQVF